MGAQTDYETLLTAIDQLYAAALDPNHWNGFLGSLATQFEAQNAFVCEVEYRERNLAYVGLPQEGRARLPVQRYERLIGEDPRTHGFRSHGVQPVHCRMATTTERLHNSRVYREYLKPLGIEYTMVVVLPVREGVTRDLGLTRGAEGRPFDENDRALMSRLVPHVERAFTINGALETKLAVARRMAYVHSADQRLLEERLDLSPAQAQLAALLYDGKSLKQAASSLGITEGSARQYLRRIFAKTGTNRQINLIRHVSRALTEDSILRCRASMVSIESSASSDPHAYRRRVIVATSIGNALEWFDFVAYGFLAVTMARLFFPGSNDVAALLLTFGSFGVPFLVRPLGAIVMGAYADRRGRKAALILSIGLMMLGTLTMAVVPTYHSIGIIAAVIVVVARMLQGFSVGGEFGSALAFLVEQDPKQRGALASWHYASQSVTTVLATGFGVGLNLLLTPAELEAWGWRIPFVFGLLVGPAGYYIRARLRETPAFEALQTEKAPVLRVIADHGISIVMCVGAIVVSSITIYTVLFMPTFAVKQLGLSPSTAFLGGLLAGTIQIFLIPVVGLWSDRVGRTAIPLASATAILLLIYPMFAWLVAVPQLTTLLMVQGILGVLNALNFGCLGGLISELFPTRVRASGLSIANAVAQTLFGGFTPFMCVWLIDVTGSQLAPSFYLMFGAAVSIAALVMVRRTGVR